MEVIVLGTNHNNTLGLLWSLGEAGHHITLLLYKEKRMFVDKSKYISSLYLIDEGTDVIDLIKNVSSVFKEKPVVFVSNDADATLLNEHFEELTHFCFFEGGKPDGSINKYRDKDTENQLAIKCGFDLPRNCIIKTPSQIDSVNYNYPILVKANNSVHGGKAAMKKCDTIKEAKHFVDAIPIDYFPLQVQEFIEKEYEIMLLGCSLNGGDDFVCSVANRKLRQYPKYVGLGSFSESINVETHSGLSALAKKVKQYIKEIHYTGSFSAEFLYCKGKYYFLEINLRNDGTSYLSTASGYNLPDFVARSFEETKIQLNNCVFKPMNYMNILADFQYVRNQEIKLCDWIKLFNKKTVFSHYNRKDRKPFIKYMWNYFIGRF